MSSEQMSSWQMFLEQERNNSFHLSAEGKNPLKVKKLNTMESQI
jgi:hypothetical protein